MMSRIKALPKWLQGKYVAEDDFWKITNHFVEMSRRGKAYAKAGIKEGDEVIDFMGRKQRYGDDFLKKESAHIVKNTVPNYAFVGDFVRLARSSPFGNFMSFPSEIIRTSSGIGEQIVRELKHSRPTRGSNLLPIVWDVQLGKFVKKDNPMYAIGSTKSIRNGYNFNCCTNSYR